MAINTAFSYKSGKTFLHRCPAWIKILLIPLISIGVFKLPFVFAAGLFICQFILACFIRISLRDQLKDLQAVLYYALILLFARLVASGFSADFFEGLMPTLILLLKLFCLMQTASLVFKTSTSLELREGLEKMELAVRRLFRLKACAPLAQSLALFLCFIPMVSKNWAQAKAAWYARGGKKSIRMLLVLLPVLFSVGMKQAWNSARALTARSLVGRIPG